MKKIKVILNEEDIKKINDYANTHLISFNEALRIFVKLGINNKIK